MIEGLSPNLQHLETSATIAISAEAKRRKAAGEDVVDLGAGEPDFPTPPIPAEAGIRAIKDGKTHYPANEGILELRAAAATHLSLLSGGRPVNADHIVVSNGSKQSLFNVCFSVFGPGDVVAIPAPAWVSYPQIVHLARARPALVPGDPEWGLKMSVRDLERVVPGAQGLILCSPCNPTGAVYTHAELKAIATWARDRKVWVIADEIYRRIHYGPGPAPSFLDLPDDLLERVVIIYGVSKAYAMTGWRVGLALAPAKVAKAMAALQSHTTTGANHPAQWAAAAALGDERVEQDVTRMVAEFRKRRELRRPVRQHFDALVRHEAIVFDPHAELSELVDPRFDREHHARLEARLVALDEVGYLVTVHPEAVTEAVREEAAVAPVADHLARGAVHLLALRVERLPELHRGGLGVVEQIEDLLEFGRRGVAEPDGARDVGLVP